jgi:hypothetical protein
MNRQLPKQIDAFTRWDRVEAGPGKSYSYMYTIGKTLSESEKRGLQAQITSRALATPEMKPIFDDGVTVWYKYHDGAGQQQLAFSVKR